MDHLRSLIRRAAYFFLGVALAFVLAAPWDAHAYTATSTSSAPVQGYGIQTGTTTVGFTRTGYTSLVAACQSISSAEGGRYATGSTSGWQSWTYTSQVGGSCKGTLVQAPYPDNTAAQGGFASATGQACTSGTLVGGNCITYTCPNGGTLSGSTCTCPVGQVDTGTACSVTCPGAQVKVNNTCTCQTGVQSVGMLPDLTPVAAFWEFTMDKAAFTAAPATSSGCRSSCTVTARKAAWVTGTAFYDLAQTGELCVGDSKPNISGSTPVATNPTDDEACLARGGMPYTLNGVRMCLDKGKVSEGIQIGKSDTGVKTVTNPDGTSTTTTTTQSPTTICQAGACETTITTTTITQTKDAAGVVTGTTTTTNTVKNPGGNGSGAPGAGGPCDPATTQCGDDSSFGGTCAAGFNCSGDAIQCAIAREQYVRNCQTLGEHATGTQPTAAATWYDSNSGGEGLAQSNTDLYKTGTLPTLDKTSRSLSGAALSDLNVTVQGQPIAIPFSKLNDVLGYLGYLLMAVAFIVATRIYHKGVVG